MVGHSHPTLCKRTFCTERWQGRKKFDKLFQIISLWNKVVISYKYPTTEAQVLDMLTEQCENHDQNQNRNPCDELREKQKAKTRCNILIRLPFSTTYRVSICVCLPGLYSTPFSMYCVTQGAHTGDNVTTDHLKTDHF